MKNQSYLLVLLFAIFIFSCKKTSISDSGSTVPRCVGGASETELYIDGPNEICIAESKTYSIGGGFSLDGGGFVNWSVDQPGVATLVTSGASVTVTRIASGPFKLKAYVWSGALCSVPMWLTDKTINECQTIVSGGIYSLVSALDSNYEIGVYEPTFSRLTVKGPVQLQKNDAEFGFYYGWRFEGSGEDYTVKCYNSNQGLNPVGSSGLEISYTSIPTWKIKPTGDGYFYIEDPVSGNRVSIPASGATTGTLLQRSAPGTGLNQKWKLVPILRVNDPYSRETMTIASYDYSGDIVFTNQTTSEQTTVSNVLPNTFRTIYLKTTNRYTVTFTNGPGVTQVYASLVNPHGSRNWWSNISPFTTDYTNIWTEGGPYVLRVSPISYVTWAD